MASQVERSLSSSFEKTLIQHTLLAEKFLALFKNMIIGNISPSFAQDDIAEVTEEYLQTSLKSIDVKFDNIKELSNFLAVHFVILNPLIEFCLDIRKEVGQNVDLRLILKKELEDNSNFQSISLFVNDKNNNENILEQLEKIKEHYCSYFREAEVLFTCQPDYFI